MITTKFLKDIYTEARPIIERHLDDAELLAGMREVVAAQGGDWSSLKALITADVKDGRDEAGDGKRVKKILDKADYSAAYADMLGLNMNDGNNSADEVPHDPETGETIEPELPETANDLPAQESSGKSNGESLDDKSKAARPASVDAQVNDERVAGQTTNEVVTSRERPAPSKPDMDIPDFLRRTKPPPELVE